MFWGKLAHVDGCVQFHPLRDHCLDVAVVFGELVRLSGIRSILHISAGGPIAQAQVARLAAVAFLHDIGKCNHGFQAKREPSARRTAGHVVEAAAFLIDDAIRRRWPPPWYDLVAQMCGWFRGADEQLLSMLLAAISHHGRPVSWTDVAASSDRALRRWWEPADDLVPMLGIEELVATLHRSFPEAFIGSCEPIDAGAAFQQRFAGLVMLADWIGSDTHFFPYRDSDAEDRRTLATDAARRALQAIGLAPPAARGPIPFARAFTGFKPTPLQSYTNEALSLDESSHLVLIESDTGSGKTEAALAWFFRTYAAGVVDGLYFALPTRVAAKELYGRVCRAVESAFPDPDARPGPVLLAAPGYVKVDGEQPMLPNPQGHLWEDDAEQRRRERQWASAHPKRFLAAPIAVGTIDQALLSALQVKHSLLRSVCLDRHLLVIDEVHASDPYMRQLTLALLEGHRSRGGWAMLLSATLGESAASRFFGRKALPVSESVARPYPLVETLTGQKAMAKALAGKTVRVEMIDSIEDAPMTPALADAVAAGARVLVVCNTVSRANALLRAIEASGQVRREALFSIGGVVCPHHGRFSRDHREHLDAAVSARLGKGSGNGPFLLIGTQTLEQSLDIDADWLVSDLCPMDVLLQRIGRLHRHARTNRPTAFALPRVLVRVPGRDLSRLLRGDGGLRAPGGLGTVYVDGRVLQRTLDLLGETPVIELPRDNRRLIEESTHPQALARLPSVWVRHGQEVEGSAIAQVRAALTSTLEDKPFGELHYASDEGRVATRLGAGNLELALAHPMSLPFGIVTRRVGIPAHMAPHSQQGLPDRIDAVEFAEGFRFGLAERRYRYTRFGLERDDDA